MRGEIEPEADEQPDGERDTVTLPDDERDGEPETDEDTHADPETLGVSVPLGDTDGHAELVIVAQFVVDTDGL